MDSQIFPPEPLDHLRPQFEASVKLIAVERFNYSNSDAMLSTLIERNRNGRYAVEWVRGAWEGFMLANANLATPLLKLTKVPTETGLYWYYENGAEVPRPVMVNNYKWAGKFKWFNGAEQSWLRDGEYLVGPQQPPAQ